MPQRILAVLRLVTRLCILNDYLVGLTRERVDEFIMQPHTGLHFVDVLSSCTGAAERIPTDTGRVNLHLDRIIDQRYHKHTRKTRHSLALRVIRTDPYQTMYTVFALQITVRHIALDIECHGLDARFVTFLQVLNRHLVVMLFAVPHIHTHELFCPVLRFGTTGTGHDLKHRRHLIFFMRKHVLHLQVFHLVQRLRICRIDFLFGHQFFLVIIEGERQFLNGGTNALVPFYPALDTFHFSHLRLGGFRVVPESRRLRVQFFFFKLNTLLIDLQVCLQFVCTLLYIF